MSSAQIPTVNVDTQATVHVVATTSDGTRAALATAVPFARGARAKLVVVVPHIVPYPVALDTPAESLAFFARRYRRLVSELGGEARVEICLCRSIDDAVARMLPAQGTIVVGGPVGRWLTSPEERFANRLSERGARVIFAASGGNATQRRIAATTVIAVALLAVATRTFAQAPSPAAAPVSYGSFIDVGALIASTSPENHLFRNRGTTPRVDEVDVNMAAAYLRKPADESTRLGGELTVQGGDDSKVFGFSATAPNIAGADVLRHFGPANVAYLAPVGSGLTIQGGIFNSLIGYDSLYAKDNLAHTRPWGADYTPYLMLGMNVSYPATSKLTVTAAVVNGYWHLADANDVPSAAGQIAYKLSDRVSIKQTGLVGPHQANTSVGFWRVLSDTIVERKTERTTSALEYQLSVERVDAPEDPEALCMSAQVPVHWTVTGPVSATVRPEFCWDRDGRWTGFSQRVFALTAGGEYRASFHGAHAIVRAEYRVDDSRGPGGGFFAGADNHLTSTQNLFVVALIVAYDGSVNR